MLELSRLNNDKEAVIAGLKKKGFKEIDLVDRIIDLDEQRRSLQQELDNDRSTLNSISKEIGLLFREGKREEAEAKKAETKEVNERIAALDTKNKDVLTELQDQLVKLPNLPHSSVPSGMTPEENEEVFRVSELPDLGDNAKAHWDLGTEYDIIDMELGTKITGSGFPVFKGKGAKLQRALISFFLDQAIEAGYQEVIPPLLVNEDTAFATGQLPDKEGQMYEMKQEPYFLIPTAEVPVTNIFRDMILKEDELPKKTVAYTPCFRREAGAYGKDVRGLNRVHQFDKVEIVQVRKPEDSYDALEEMVAHVTGLLEKLELPYRKLRLCGGDMSFTSALTFDMEVYAAGQKRWLEVSSISNFETFQSNRLKLRIRGGDKKTRLAHTLNGSALALPRIVVALLENNQTAEGIVIPAVLRPYTGFDRID